MIDHEKYQFNHSKCRMMAALCRYCKGKIVEAGKGGGRLFSSSTVLQQRIESVHEVKEEYIYQ